METQIAQTILGQLGGQRFIAMTGAKNLTAGIYNLTFRFPAKSGANFCRITLTPMDVYKMEFFRLKWPKIGAIVLQPVKTYEDVYCDMLQDIFTKQTGLYTHL